MFFHGTSQQAAEKIKLHGLKPGSFVTSEFYEACYYALPNGVESAVVLAFQNIEVQEPNEVREFSPEMVVLGNPKPVKVLQPNFALPHDWYEVDDNISGQKYPNLFQMESWHD